MKIQSQIIAFNGAVISESKRGLPVIFSCKPGFLIIEVLVSLLFCFVFILALLKFQSEILFLYERSFMRNMAINIALNAVEDSRNFTNSRVCKKIVYCGRSFDLIYGVNKDFVENSTDNLFGGVVVKWRSSFGCDEKFTIG